MHKRNQTLAGSDSACGEMKLTFEYSSLHMDSVTGYSDIQSKVLICVLGRCFNG